MTKKKFLEQIKFYTGPYSLWPARLDFETVVAAEYRAFDPELADKLEAATEASRAVLEYMRTRVEANGQAGRR